MRTLLIIVAITNLVGAVGGIILAFVDETYTSVFMKVGAALDAAAIELSIVVIALALLKILPRNAS
ncbi:MAG: hypothetical protein WBG08_10750 [Litorimonas sp.]